MFYKLFLTLSIFLFLSPLGLTAKPLPQPSQEDVEKSAEEVRWAMRKEFLSPRSLIGLPSYLINHYAWGNTQKFDDYGSNPSEISQEESQRPAILLFHSDELNQGEWLPLLYTLCHSDSSKLLGPIFTFDAHETNVDGLDLLHKKIASIKDIYQKAGSNNVTLHFVGHSSGATTAAHYAFDKTRWIDGTTVSKVISIAGRLKNIPQIEETPFYAHYYPTLKNLDSLFARIEKNRGQVKLYTVAAEDDLLVPRESVLVGDNEKRKVVIPGKGHLLVAFAEETHEYVTKWLLD